MHIIYLGKEQGRVGELENALGRSIFKVLHAPLPETAYFQILHNPIQAIFLDLKDLGTAAAEVVATLYTLDSNLEIVFIGPRTQVDAFSAFSVRGCYGHLEGPFHANSNQLVINQLTDKLSLKGRLESLKSTSISDGLTQLYNHAYFQSQLDEEIRILKESFEEVSLVFLDVDHFKHYNDTNGHPAGDGVLRKAAELLDGSIRKFDFAARYGGEEFALVLPGCDLRSAIQVAERTRATLAHHNFPHGEKQPLGRVTASFGVATLTHVEIKTKQELVKRADEALYHAKKAGRNRIWYFLDGKFHPAVFHAEDLTDAVEEPLTLE